MTTTAQASRIEAQVAGLRLEALRGGAGSPVLVLGHETGHPGWLAFHETLAAKHDVVAPFLPGWDDTERSETMRSVRDIAVLFGLFLDELELGQVDLVGIGFGGFVAAEMATMQQRRLSHLALVGPMGLKPREGEIADQFLAAHEAYMRNCFANPEAYTAVFGEEASSEQLVAWDANREMTARTAWKPFLYSQTLNEFLPNVRTSSLIVRGADDRVVPAACAALYAELLPNARSEEMAGGHALEMENGEMLAGRLAAFFAS